MTGWPSELAVDQQVLDLLADQATFAADTAICKSLGQISRIPNPDGGEQGLTSAEQTRLGMRAGIRNLLMNGLIEAKPLEEILRIFEQGVTIS